MRIIAIKRAHGAYILARYSTDNQNPDSIDVQVRKCREWCREHGLAVLDVFADEATSGMKDTRPEYERMMAQLGNGGADTVVIYDQSRMFRKMTAWFSFRDKLERLGVRVVSVTQPAIGGDLRDPTIFLTEGSMALFNQIWALQTRQKVIEKMRFMATNKLHTGGKPALGYMVVDRRLEICPPEAETVRRIFREYAGGRSYREIIAGLNADGIRTRTGKTFGTNSLHDLLKNEKYIGVLTYGKVEKAVDGTRNSHGEPSQNVIRIEDALPAIIDRDTWERVQRRMDINKRQGAGRPATVRDYPLKGKVFCGECKSAMTSSRSSGKYYYYSCGAKQRKGDCDNMPIRADLLESYVADVVRGMLGDPQNVEELLCILREERARLQGSAASRLMAMIDRRDELDAQLEKAIQAVLAGMNSPALTQKVNDLEEQKAALEHEMQQLHSSVSGSAVTEEALRELLPLALDSDAIFSLIFRVEVYKDKIMIWTMLDTTPRGDIDLSAPGLVRSLPIPGDGSPAPWRVFLQHLKGC